MAFGRHGVGVPLYSLYLLLALLEEREMKVRFGEEFEAYRREVPRFIPRFKRP